MKFDIVGVSNNELGKRKSENTEEEFIDLSFDNKIKWF